MNIFYKKNIQRNLNENFESKAEFIAEEKNFKI